jgi:hypothetical protein
MPDAIALVCAGCGMTVMRWRPAMRLRRIACLECVQKSKKQAQKNPTAKSSTSRGTFRKQQRPGPSSISRTERMAAMRSVELSKFYLRGLADNAFFQRAEFVTCFG